MLYLTSIFDRFSINAIGYAMQKWLALIFDILLFALKLALLTFFLSSKSEIIFYVEQDYLFQMVFSIMRNISV